MLVGVAPKGDRSPGGWTLLDSTEELGQLARTAGAIVAGAVTQLLERPSPTYLGTGKLQELIRLQPQLHYTVAIFDDELSPTQQKRLEGLLKVKVIDRTALILDIFSKHARTREGRLQVELAQNQYLLPRLAGQWAHLERLGGGIGTRGPGEKQLETDRRLLSERIHRLQEEIEEVRRHRVLYREQRRKSGIPLVSLVGYTNAGKSTLMNALSRANVLVEDKLFATLDPTTRKVVLPDGRQFLLTDTVGFIRKLPPTLLASFRATLEELEEADLLLHVVDITHRNAAEQAETVEEILRDLGLAHTPRIAALNKVDRLADLKGGDVSLEDLAEQCGDAIKAAGEAVALVSATKGWGLERLLELVGRSLASHRKTGAHGQS